MRQTLIIIAMMLSFNAHAQYKRPVVTIWEDAVPGATKAKSEPRTQMGRDGVWRMDEVTNPTLEIFEPADGTGNGQAVIVCPGGAYAILAYDKEGQEIAEWLSRQGFHAFVLAYRVPNNRAGALQDAQRAIREVRSIGFGRVGIIGFSAGGSLSARAATRWAEQTYEPIDAKDTLSSRPDFAMLIYPAYLDEGEGGTLTPELTVNSETSPMFVFGTEDDVRYSGPSCLTIADAMRRAGAPIELHYLARGGHGYGMRTGVGLIWPALAETWLKQFTH
ncbi:MAG: alpha/beta hydrolase [Bacteroidaceae bacterium]|nr:alpha/beta hydrolase [Bacteroidaceae bacterium]